MQRFHPLSFVAGAVSGVVVLVVIVGGMRLVHGSSPDTALRGNGQFRQFQAGGGGLDRMAERLGMTREELQKELDSGKTMQDIATEKGIELPAGGGRQGGFNRSSARSQSGSVTSALSSSSSSQPQ